MSTNTINKPSGVNEAADVVSISQARDKSSACAARLWATGPRSPSYILADLAIREHSTRASHRLALRKWTTKYPR